MTFLIQNIVAVMILFIFTYFGFWCGRKSVFYKRDLYQGIITEDKIMSLINMATRQWEIDFINKLIREHKDNYKLTESYCNLTKALAQRTYQLKVESAQVQPKSKKHCKPDLHII